jgi:hypothetical protein
VDLQELRPTILMGSKVIMDFEYGFKRKTFEALQTLRIARCVKADIKYILGASWVKHSPHYLAIAPAQRKRGRLRWSFEISMQRAMRLWGTGNRVQILLGCYPYPSFQPLYDYLIITDSYHNQALCSQWTRSNLQTKGDDD